MDNTMIKTQAVKFSRARANLLVLIAFTVINLIILLFDFNIAFLFSAFVPQLLFIVMEDLASAGLGMIIALLAVSVYGVCHLLSKKRRVFMLIAFILFVIDAVIMLGMMMWLGDFSSFIFNILFHTWILFYLFTGSVAWYKLRKVTASDLEMIQQEVAQETEAKELDSALDNIVPSPTVEDDHQEAEEPDSFSPYHTEDESK